MREPSQYNRATAAQVMAHVHLAVDCALDYFGQDNSDFRVYVYPEAPADGSPATCSVDLAYQRAGIRVNVDEYAEHPELIWPQMGHEVAHLVTREVMRLRPVLTKTGSFKETAYTEAIESATTRLERMWSRDVPDPGWEG